MKLLLDENLSPRLVEILSSMYPDCRHVDSQGLHGKADTEIWEYAKARGYVIVSKDNDFRQRSFLHGAPPKVIWLRVGNLATDEIAKVLSRGRSEIESFAQDPDAALLIVGAPTDGAFRKA